MLGECWIKAANRPQAMDVKSSHPQIGPFSLSLRHFSIEAVTIRKTGTGQNSKLSLFSILAPCTWIVLLYLEEDLEEYFPANKFLVIHPQVLLICSNRLKT